MRGGRYASPRGMISTAILATPSQTPESAPHTLVIFANAASRNPPNTYPKTFII